MFSWCKQEDTKVVYQNWQVGHVYPVPYFFRPRLFYCTPIIQVENFNFVTGYTFSLDNFVNTILPPYWKWVYTRRKGFAAHPIALRSKFSRKEFSKIYPFYVDPFSEEAARAELQTRIHKSCLPCKKGGKSTMFIQSPDFCFGKACFTARQPFKL